MSRRVVIVTLVVVTDAATNSQSPAVIHSLWNSLPAALRVTWDDIY